ncbi:M23 family metallopeptidase [Streptomyces sp. F63]|uniref:M23 family metallopeptidase n=1 Tax=Streptomyces sp. F63 TaxID=2824887 RepID=UPI001B365BDD|nr:M23 family metallopeptidase [Streptomyces sp. F63]MBQ0984760.1 M23 family metallopeptidase [Streptomyces sp. F63]
MDVKRGAALCPASAAVPRTPTLALVFLLAAFGDEEEPALVAAGAPKIRLGGGPAAYAGLLQEAAARCPEGPPAAVPAAQPLQESGFRAGPYGRAAVIRPPDGMHSQYAHRSRLDVRPGQTVDGGRRIVRTGSTGNSSGPHLRFEIRTAPEYGSDVEPIPYPHSHGLEV